jgi:hypothetical protein
MKIQRHRMLLDSHLSHYRMARAAQPHRIRFCSRAPWAKVCLVAPVALAEGLAGWVDREAGLRLAD